ncbi:hypothetical protein BB561_005685 [Smittium simulii]|uniref:Uncharacterized protein n=1 Tax=Smittium simulii TaxID=133385 RepID=A0A2T9Y8Z7_9FUNG|nr:hypothetical protein BB561_005685 [Smittium simulii]
MENIENQKAVKQLQSEKNNTPQTELPHVFPRAPVADLIFFSKFFTKSNVMHYVPPELSNTASVAVKKVDNALYVQNSPKQNHSKDPDIKFDLEMRLLLADIASGIIQLQQNLSQQVLSGIAFTTAQNQKATSTDSSSQSYNDNKEQKFWSRKKKKEIQEIPEIHMEWENIPVQSSSVRSFPEPFSLYQNTTPNNNVGTSLENKDCVLSGQNYNIVEEPTNMPGKHHYSFIKAQRTRISDQRLKIIFCSKTDNQTPENAYQLQADDSESPNRQGSRLEKGSIQVVNQGKNYTQRVSFIHLEGTSNGCSTTPRTPNVEKIVGTKKQSLVKNIRLEFSSVNKGQCIAVSDLVERSTTSMEWGYLWDPNPTQDVDSIRDLSPYEQKKIISDIKSAMSYGCCAKICLDLFRQYHVDFVHQKTWKYYFSKIIKSFRTNIVNCLKTGT